MLQQDYLMRMIMQLIQGIRKSMRRAVDEKDPEAAADMLEATVGEATELDGAVLLSLSPESIASVVQISGTEPRVVEYICRTLMLEADYLRDAVRDYPVRGGKRVAYVQIRQRGQLADHLRL